MFFICITINRKVDDKVDFKIVSDRTNSLRFVDLPNSIIKNIIVIKKSTITVFLIVSDIAFKVNIGKCKPSRIFDRILSTLERISENAVFQLSLH